MDLTDINLVFILRWFMPCLFLGQTVFLLIIGRQISLMDNLFQTDKDSLLKSVNYFLLALSLLGFLLSLIRGF